MKTLACIILLAVATFLLAVDNLPLNSPVIGINGGLVQDFGSQYLGYASSPRSIQIQNTGNATLIVQSLDVPNAGSPFALINPPMPLYIPSGGTSDFWMIFLPTRLGSVSDSLIIVSNDPANQSLKLRLTGVGTYVPPAAVQNLAVNISGEDAILSWDPVSTTIFGLPIVPDRYVVLFCQTSGTEHFWQLANTAGLSYTHLGVATYCPSMFYRVKAVMLYRDEDSLRLDSLINSKALLTQKEVDELFTGFLLP